MSLLNKILNRKQLERLVQLIYASSIVVSVIYALRVSHLIDARRGKKEVEKWISHEKSKFHCRKNPLPDMLPTTTDSEELSFSQTLGSSHSESKFVLPDKDEQEGKSVAR